MKGDGGTGGERVDWRGDPDRLLLDLLIVCSFGSPTERVENGRKRLIADGLCFGGNFFFFSREEC